MKIVPGFVLIILFTSCAHGKEINYTGSTPAHSLVREFLGISMSDSIDFIRWKLSLTDYTYTLSCNYGIGKPNTNGFINGGKWVNISGKAKRDNNNYHYLDNNGKIFTIAELNIDLLHLMDNNKNLLVGNGGWSYTLSNEKPLKTGQLNINSKKIVLNDSMVFQGRTPCIKYADIRSVSDCYKLKWSIVLYSDRITKQPTTYSLRGTVIDHKTKTGTWAMTTGKNGRNIVHLLSENKQSLYFLMPDENILLFTNAEGNLLIGDKDFSYTLNRMN